MIPPSPASRIKLGIIARHTPLRDRHPVGRSGLMRKVSDTQTLDSAVLIVPTLGVVETPALAVGRQLAKTLSQNRTRPSIGLLAPNKLFAPNSRIISPFP